MSLFFRKSLNRKRLSRMVADRKQVDIPASRACIGMHVVGLDRPWEEVPVLFQKFIIDQPEQVEILRTHCQWITVERTAWTEQVAQEAIAHRKAIAAGSDFEAKRPLSEELPHALQAYHRAQQYIDDLLDRVVANQELPLAEARALRQVLTAAGLAFYAISPRWQARHPCVVTPLLRRPGTSRSRRRCPG